MIQNGVNVDDLILEMDDEWAAMDTIVAVFTLKYTDEGEKVIAKEMLHTFGNPLRVPWECLTYTGQLFVSCTGYVGGEKVMTTMYPESFWNVVQSGPVTGDTPLEPTPTLYEQILSAYSKANEAAENAENVAEQLLEDKANGVFNGEPGKDGQTPKFTISRFTETGGRGGVNIRLLTPTGENSAEVTQLKLYDGKNGTNGSSPKIGSDGFWYVGSTATGVKARGDDYVLTDADKQEIAEIAAELVDVSGGGGSGEPGKDGITPHIGANGNWFIGETDTGVKAQGEDGNDYVLTDVDKQEIAEQAAELVEVPEGGGGIDVSGATVGQTVKIAAVDGNGVPTAWEATDFPESSGGGEKPWRLINTITFPSDEASATGTWHITEDADGNPFELDEVLLDFDAKLYATAKSQNYVRCNQTQYIQWAMYGFFDTSDKNNRGRILHFRKMTPYHIDCVGYSTAATTHTMPAYVASGEKIKAVGIQGGQTLVDGTVKMWGR